MTRRQIETTLLLVALAAAVVFALRQRTPRATTPGAEQSPAANSAADVDTTGPPGPEQSPPTPEITGRWRPFRSHLHDEHLTDAQRREIERLEAIGYVGAVREAPDLEGVTRHDRAFAWRGLNLYSSGHAPEAILMDMDGRILHRWRRPFAEVFPEYPLPRDAYGRLCWRRVHALPNGDLLVIYEGLGMARLDRDSNVIWANPGKFHHDLEVLPGGEILSLAREAHLVPHVSPDAPILEDFVVLLDSNGVELRRVSVLAAMECLGRKDIWPGSEVPKGDIFHTNTVSIVPEGLSGLPEPFQPGRVLTYLRTLSAIVLLDLDTGCAVWAHTGAHRMAHDPKLLPGGHMLLFDNLIHADSPNGVNWSRVIELDPLTMAVTWSFTGSEQTPFFSGTCGAAQRLPNGNTLITESDNGRALEVDPEGRIVWEFYNPQRSGPGGRLIATLFEMERLPADFGAGWLQ